MNRKLIDKTSRYCFEKLVGTGYDHGPLEMAKDLSTTFVHSGEAVLSLESKGNLENIKIREGQGFIISPGILYNFNPNNGAVAYSVSSEIGGESPIIEIIDDQKGKREVVLEDWKIIKNPKRVSKPWGHELWISWFRDYHVLKQIGMNKGNQSSLQFHREKLETNYLESGHADVIDGYKLDPQTSEQEVQASSKGVDFDKFRISMSPGDHWTSDAGVVHRVIATENYLAYETSTPELDDVIRISDVTGRGSGRIKEEHKTGRKK